MQKPIVDIEDFNIFGDPSDELGSDPRQEPEDGFEKWKK
ncbi:hypothetical protein VCHA53O468_140028 [Vibrio chagasii]|nr:hypothetical protein VCHA53O468_140028 [Vibrio chagasii]CAH7002116.1 hypothetical protein VCHA55O507_130120 [Vibrio chagasii]